MIACELWTCRKLHRKYCTLGLFDFGGKKSNHIELWTLTDMTVGNKRQNIRHHDCPPSSHDPPFLSHAFFLTLSILLATAVPKGGAVMKMNASD